MRINVSILLFLPKTGLNGAFSELFDVYRKADRNFFLVGFHAF